MPTQPPTALLLDVDSEHTRALRAAVEAAGFSATVSVDTAGISHKPRIAFISMDCGKVAAMHFASNELLSECVEVILMAEQDDPVKVRKAIANGATYFFCKPFDPEFIRPLLHDVYTEVAAAHTAGFAPIGEPLDQFGLLRGSSPAMRKLYRILRKVGPTDTSVLLIGESGTGKELAARTLHSLSEVADGPFLAMNCAAIPHDLIESEMFGHERGSFSGAEKQHHGFFERAAGGTLFLDEITEMPAELQVKLLRVLEAAAFRRIGGEHDISTNVRIIAATNCDPEDAIATKKLREDLYYRIARFPIWIPPLRSRAGDIVGLAQYFLTSLNEEHATATTISAAALATIQNYSWPGNVRELRSAIERAYILADVQIVAKDLADIQDTQQHGQLRISVGESVETAERKLIFATLEASNGNKQAAADTLGISLKTLYNRLNKYARQERRGSDSDSDRVPPD